MTGQMLKTLFDEFVAFGKIAINILSMSVWDLLGMEGYAFAIPSLFQEWLKSSTLFGVFIGGALTLFLVYTLVKWILDVAL